MSIPARFSSSLHPVRPKPNLSIELTPIEDQLCTLLDDCTKDLRKSRPELTPVECRIAGGWVRDKLLGLESNDIDIALSSMMGVTFADHFVSFLASKGQIVRNAVKVARNPDQSKHLETAMVTVLGLDVDLVNLRSEVYADDSRIPSEVVRVVLHPYELQPQRANPDWLKGFGTPLEDALRRDITINSLFYNVHTRSVEDHTRKGLEDLKSGIIRTPLAPHETFMDDPLRVLRCVRFASRFEYELAPGVREAIQERAIRNALAAKISRERIGIEIDKMLKGPNPLLPLQMIEELALHDAIFWFPKAWMDMLSHPPGPRSLGLAASSVLHSLLSQFDGLKETATSQLPSLHPSLFQHAGPDKAVRRRLYLAAAMTPFKGITYLEKKKPVSAMEGLIRVGLKLGNQNHYLDGITALFDASTLLSRPNQDRFVSPSGQRVALGLVLRNERVHKPQNGSHWSSSLLFSLVQDLVGVWDYASNEFDSQVAHEIIEIYNNFVERVEELDVPSSVDEKPILDGRTIGTLLSLKPGPHTGRVLSHVVEWQLGHPGGSVNDCQAWLKAEHEAGRLLPDIGSAGDGKRSSGQEGRAQKKPRT